ncbi:MAG: Helix-turn-helix domain [Acidimicrobiaceae bacterium]
MGVGVGQAELVDEIVWSSRLGAHLTAFRQRAGLRRIDLARQIGVSDESVRLWEKGTVRPSRELLARLIALLSLEVADWSESDSQPQKAELPVVARRLREERQARGISQAATVRLLDVAQGTYASWETGRCSPAEQHHEAIASFLGIGPEEVTAMCEVPFSVDTSTWPPLGQIVGRQREVRQLRRADLAEQLGVAASTIAAWELGSRVPGADHLRRLATTLDLELAVLAASVPQREDRTPLGELIVSRRRELGIRSADVARRAGTSETVISRWVNGHHRPVAASLRRLAHALDLPFATVAAAVGGSDGA